MIHNYDYCRFTLPQQAPAATPLRPVETNAIVDRLLVLAVLPCISQKSPGILLKGGGTQASYSKEQSGPHSGRFDITAQASGWLKNQQGPGRISHPGGTGHVV
jgi:hypothetical protein